MPLVAQPDTATSNTFAYGSGRRRIRQRHSQGGREPSSISTTERLSPRKSGLSVLLEDGPATDTGVYYNVSDLVTMRRRELVGVLGSMGQSVGKRRPTRLELLGAVVTLLCDMDRLRLLFFSIPSARHCGGRDVGTFKIHTGCGRPVIARLRTF